LKSVDGILRSLAERAWVSTVGIYFLLSLTILLGLWVAIGGWEVLGPFAVVGVITGPFALAVALYMSYIIWHESGTIFRLATVFIWLAVAALIVYGMRQEGLSLIRWGGVMIVVIPALALSGQMSVLLALLPFAALGNRGSKWMKRIRSH
jgi:hypothetical protein